MPACGPTGLSEQGVTDSTQPTRSAAHAADVLVYWNRALLTFVVKGRASGQVQCLLTLSWGPVGRCGCAGLATPPDKAEESTSGFMRHCAMPS